MGTAEYIEQKTILVVDDDNSNLRLLCALVSMGGYVALAAESGEAAILMAQAEQPNMILLDVRMPRINGYDVCDALQADPRTRDIPVGFVTAMGDQVDRERMQSCGCVGVLSKPIRRDDLYHFIELHLP